MPTGKEMCETIAEALKKRDPNITITPKEIWEYSSTGELTLVFSLYHWAVLFLELGKEPEPADYLKKLLR